MFEGGTGVLLGRFNVPAAVTPREAGPTWRRFSVQAAATGIFRKLCVKKRTIQVFVTSVLLIPPLYLPLNTDVQYAPF